ncbi:MAG TPA: hypothetical protein DCZ69_13635, partial [Syntrophobacteraceae bacterium]|nr:hypothetical protein [Syntrophobacteraceae bacterium]
MFWRRWKISCKVYSRPWTGSHTCRNRCRTALPSWSARLAACHRILHREVLPVSIPITFGRLEVGLVASLEEHRTSRPEPETPFRILVLADFGGRRNRGRAESLRGRRFHRIDRDSFDEILKKCAPRLHLPILGKDSAPIAMEFAELEDFHPDGLYQKIELF